MISSAASNLRVHDDTRRVVRQPDDIQHRALARLYERKSALENLISALERYQQEKRGLTAK
jgi:hypothetical protein